MASSVHYCSITNKNQRISCARCGFHGGILATAALPLVLCSKLNRASEILMHLEIYKSVPEAKAVVHCHPPHATAYAITGRVPPTCIIPEYEVFIGKVALDRKSTRLNSS